jgi:hypothetical protein
MTERLRAASGMRICAFWRSVTNSLPRTSTAVERASVRTVAPGPSARPLTAGRVPRESITTTRPLASLTVQFPLCAKAVALPKSSTAMGSNSLVRARIPVSLTAGYAITRSSQVEGQGKLPVKLSID